MFVSWNEREAHAEALKRGLARLGPDFAAQLCWWCEGTTSHRFEHCSVCGYGKFCGTALGLLQGDSKPAPESVVNQVLVAAELPG
jgi:hypothetical protein